MIVELYNSNKNLEKLSNLEIPALVVFLVADVVAIAAKMGVKVE